MIYYRLLGKYSRRTRWKKINGASNLRQGVEFVETNLAQLRTRDATTWEVGCNVPPRITPQARRSGSIDAVS
jgi:hypothetical protein